MAGLRKAIDMKCAECIYDPKYGNGSWRAQVEACTATTCPLYGVRPLTQGSRHSEPIVIPDIVAERRLEYADGT